MDGGGQYNPRTVEEVFRDFKGRRAGMVKALTTDVEEFYQQCDPGLPLDFTGSSLRVHWKRRDGILVTRPAKVLQGMVEFEL
ncbi:phd finger protein alfin-like 4 [Quercus suber]|uniref:PHD finger protein ALFIN-LIKE n=1 Tax=Quercus suber TaxID=58331 RepID=A0AAW0LK95_QUESU